MFRDVDLRNWLPGDRWDSVKGAYLEAATPVVVQGVFPIPKNMPRGTYVVAMAVLDPAGMAPSLRFAARDYFRGGRHPLGFIGVGQTPLETAVNPSVFDDLQSDTTLEYLLR